MSQIEELCGLVERVVSENREDQKLLGKRLDLMEALGARPNTGGGGGGLDSVVQSLAQDPGFQQLQKNGKGRTILQIKNLLLETKDVTPIVGAGLTAALGLPGIGDNGRKVYGRVRRLMRQLPIATAQAFYVKETAFGDAASPVAEASDKPESVFTFEGCTADVRTIATFTSASKQVLDDLVSLQEHIRTSLFYSLERELEWQILFGDDTVQRLNGLNNQAQSFDTSLLYAPDGWERLDVLRLAALQLEEDGYACTAFVVSPYDWALIELLKNTVGNYIAGDPISRNGLAELLWTRTVVPSPAMPRGSFIAGDFDNGCHLRMRQDMTLDISDSHADFFVKNLLACRCELRAALVVPKPGAFIQGSLSTSPI
jgi:HK97 family phage major capsid protein